MVTLETKVVTNVRSSSGKVLYLLFLSTFNRNDAFTNIKLHKKSLVGESRYLMQTEVGWVSQSV